MDLGPNPGSEGEGRDGSPASDADLAELWRAPDWRRGLQLALASLWMLDGLLQLQPFFFHGGRAGFGGMLARAATDSPGWIASSITSVATLVSQHPQATGAAFAAIQIGIGLGIAWRPTTKPALAVSVAWSLAVWWFGEGLGGLFRAATASPLGGGPGPVLFYALLAVLLWPAAVDRSGKRQVAAAAAVGPRAAAAAWLAVWFGLAALLLAAGRSPQGVHEVVAGVSPGEPPWLESLDRHTLALVAHRGLGIAVGVAVLLAAVGVSTLLPVHLARAGAALGVVVAAAFWVLTQNFGMIFPGGSTDPSSGPLLALLSVAYWPLGPARALAPSRRAPARPGDRLLPAGAG